MSMIVKMAALDWRSMKVYQIRGLLLPAIAFALGMFYSPIVIMPVCVIFCSSFASNTFAVEDKGDLNNFYLTLPLKRNTVVAGRYFLSLIILLCGVAVGVLALLITNPISLSLSKWYIGLKGHITIIALSYLMYALLEVFRYPVLFRLGYTKGRFWGIMFPAIFGGLLMGVYFSVASTSALINFIVFASENIFFVIGGMAVLATGLLAVSYFVSVRMYSKRDF